MRVLVTGATGMLGRKVVKAFARSHEVIARGRRATPEGPGLDLEDRGAIRDLLADGRPEVVVNCAAYTAVDEAESRPDLAFRGNCVGPQNLAQACRDADCALMHLSTDYVFDGEKGEAYDEWDEPCPLSVYGRSKLAGERAVIQSGVRHWIVRLQWLYGAGGRNFADTILSLARTKPSLRVVNDQHGSPTWTGHVAEQLLKLVESGRLGTYHAAATGSTTWYGFTRALLAADGRPEYPVEPVETAEFPRPARRPRYGVLRNRALELSIGNDMPSWEEGVRAFIAERSESES